MLFSWWIGAVASLLSSIHAFTPGIALSKIKLSQGNLHQIQHQLFIRNFQCFAKGRKKENKKSSVADDEFNEEDFDFSDGFGEDIKDLLLSAKDVEPSSTTEITAEQMDGEDSDDSIDADGETEEELRQYVQEITGIFAEMDDEDSNQDFVNSPDDIVDENGEDEDAQNFIVTPGSDWKDTVQNIICEVIRKQGYYVQKIFWTGNRVEVIISASDDLLNPIGPSVTALQLCHRSMYEEFELREEELAVVTKFEIVVASPGIGEILRSDQDFVSFKGFMVSISTTEIYKKKALFEGTLVERSAENVCISLKGRIVKIPRELISEVKLPKPKYESTDTEMRKLRT